MNTIETWTAFSLSLVLITRPPLQAGAQGFPAQVGVHLE